MAEIDPLSQQLGNIQGTIEGIERRLVANDAEMDRRFREVWARIGQIERSTNGWKQKGVYAGGGAGILGIVEMIRHWFNAS